MFTGNSINPLEMEYTLKLGEDKELGKLNGELERAVEEVEKVVRPLRREKIDPVERKIIKKKQDLAVGVGLAVRRIKDMLGRMGDNSFKKKFKNGMKVYENNKGDEYTRCDVCELYIEGTLPSKSINDVGPLCGGIGEEYHCPICKTYLGRQDFMRS